jgi:hypothetical protein
MLLTGYTISVFKNRLTEEMAQNEKKLKNSDVSLYWKDERYSTITPNDKLFFKVIEDNIESLTQKYNAITKDLDCLKEMAQNGAIFYRFKKKKDNNYERSFVLVRDNKEAFYLEQDKKFFVFDATADIDPRYDLDYVEIINCKEYNKPLNMTITNVNIPTSKTTLCNRDSIKLTNFIKNYIKNNVICGFGKQRKVLIVTYKNLCNRFSSEFDYVGYFGNLKGFNDYKDIFKMTHIGLNRYSNMAYFYIYCGCHMDKYKELAEMSTEETLKFLTELAQNQKSPDFLEDIMVRSILADFEQNIFRLAIRNYENTDNVQVWTFYSANGDIYNSLSNAIEKRYKEYGVNFEYEDTPAELQISKIQDRKPPKGKEMTNAQKVIKWYEKLPVNEEFKIGKVLQETQLTNTQLQNVRKKNSVIDKIFQSCKTERKGYYMKLK